MLPLPFKQRTEPSPSKEPSLSSREFTSPREKELPRTPRAGQRKTLSALPTTRMVELVLPQSAFHFQCAHPTPVPVSKPLKRSEQLPLLDCFSLPSKPRDNSPIIINEIKCCVERLCYRHIYFLCTSTIIYF
jgi:hypothetical protein